MNVIHHKIKLKDLHSGYKDSGYGTNEEDNGVIGYGGKLNIRPKYQREFVYGDKERNAVIDTILKNYPLNVMYWSDNGKEEYEVIDGQQRTISICRYMDSLFSIKVEGNYIQYDGLAEDKKEKFDNYELDVYFCEGTESEKLNWFETINIAGKVLSAQELKNAIYTGSWLLDAKRHFSRNNQGADGNSKSYVSVDTNRQELLELALKWKTNNQKDGITKYMAEHRAEPDATELRNYFDQVITWVKGTFTTYRKEMKGIDWGLLYNQFSNAKLSATTLEQKASKLFLDDEVNSKKGIYWYLLDGDESHLNLRKFSDSQKSTIYAKQNGICNKCHKHFTIDKMEADHIDPWSKGGKTTLENCQMLCLPCNRRKSDK